MAIRHTFAFARWTRTLNLVLQAFLLLTFFGGLNYLALNYGWRWDLTNHRRHTLSEETQAYLRSLEQPVKLVITTNINSSDSTANQAYREIRGLLREYKTATESKPGGKVLIEELDVYRNQLRAEALGIDNNHIVVAICNERTTVIPWSDFYEAREGVTVAFKGEQVVTSAILSVSNPVRPKIYFLAGHGEMRPSDVNAAHGLSVLADELRKRNLQVESIDLTMQKEVPDDSDLLVIAAPQGRFDPFEVELLRRYLTERAGRIVAMLPPARPHGLDDLLYDWGLVADDVLVLDTDPANFTEAGELRINAFLPHPITQSLIDNQYAAYLGNTRVVRPDPGRPLDNALRVEVIGATAETAWGESDYRATNASYDPRFDLKGLAGFEPKNRLGVIVASERVTPPKDLPFSVRGGRLVLFGNANFAANARIVARGNLTLAINAIEWCIDRDVQINTVPRPIERYQINLSKADLSKLRISLLVILPGLAALFGVVVYWTRRS